MVKLENEMNTMGKKFEVPKPNQAKLGLINDRY